MVKVVSNGKLCKVKCSLNGLQMLTHLIINQFVKVAILCNEETGIGCSIGVIT